MSSGDTEGPARWTVLDTDMQDASRLVALWESWRSSAFLARTLHYVGLVRPDQLPGLLANANEAALAGSAAAGSVATQWALHLNSGPALLPGMQRLLLDHGRVVVDLCVGAPSATLGELRLQADWVLAHPTGKSWDRWQLKALARLCRRSAVVHWLGPPPEHTLLHEAGFVQHAKQGPCHQATDGTDIGAVPQAMYDPHWTLRHARTSSKQPGHCVVVGAGLAGASTAYALAQRGWQVTVVDSHAQPAGGASGLPVGLLVPHVSADDSPRSRMSRSGVRLMLQHARMLLREGVDWCPSGALEANADCPPQPNRAGWEMAGAATAAQPGAPLPAWAQSIDGSNALWHPHAAWIRPGALVQAWLRHPGIQFCGNTHVVGLQRAAAHWQLLSAQGEVCASGDMVVLANAAGCAPLVEALAQTPGVRLQADVLGKMRSLQSLYGTLSWGEHDALGCGQALPPFPVNGNGSLISGIAQPTSTASASPSSKTYWYAGSTFETQPEQQADVQAQHAANFQKLQALLPSAASTLAPAFAQARHWQGARCVSHDRLPLVGPLELGDAPSLWVHAAMGARGLSFALLGAELLAAQCMGEPLPMEASLCKGLSAQRLRRQKAKASQSAPA